MKNTHNFKEITVQYSSPVRSAAKVGNRQLVYMDINFIDTGVPLQYLCFQNFYVSAVTIAQQVNSSYSEIILANRRLMEHSDCEKSAQGLVTLCVDEFNDLYKGLKAMRIYLLQPCAMWLNYELKQIKAYGKAATTTIGRQLSAMTESVNNKPPNTLFGLAQWDANVLLDAQRSETNSRMSSAPPMGIEYVRQPSKKRDKTRKMKS